MLSLVGFVRFAPPVEGWRWGIDVRVSTNVHPFYKGLLILVVRMLLTAYFRVYVVGSSLIQTAFFKALKGLGLELS